MELDHGTCRVCFYAIQRLQRPAGASWFHSSPADGTACTSSGPPVPLEYDGRGICGACSMTAHPGADCPQVAGQ
jgi:hypothetical protein